MTVEARSLAGAAEGRTDWRVPRPATYRVQVRPGLRPATPPPGWSTTWPRSASRHLYSRAAADRGARLRARLRRGRPPARPTRRRGGEAGRLALVAALRAHGLGLVVDIVPNHVGVAARGRRTRPGGTCCGSAAQSAYARWFDIDWSRGRLLLPVLADSPDGAGRPAAGRRRAALLRARASRSRRAPRRSATRARRTTASTTSWCPGGGATTELNYRRFFAISDLAGAAGRGPGGVRRHPRRGAALGRRRRRGRAADRPPGRAADPAGYLRAAARARAAAPGSWWRRSWSRARSCRHWPVAGTTGYDALAEVDGVLVDPAGEAPFTALDSRADRRARRPGRSWCTTASSTSATGMLRAELRRLAALAPERAGDAEEALAELLACFPVYRSYLPDGAEHLAAARGRGRPRGGRTCAGAVDRAGRRLADPDDELAVRFQQTSGAVMAKGVEDTAYYRWTRFVALQRGRRRPGPVRRCRRRSSTRRWRTGSERHPAGMTTLSTHDTKRSARTCGPGWRCWPSCRRSGPTAVARWSAPAPPPDGALGHLLWQTRGRARGRCRRERLHAYLEKAMREARTRTSWNDPDDGVRGGDARGRGRGARRRRRCAPTWPRSPRGSRRPAGPTRWPRRWCSWPCPGVPDTYQGGELWDLSLVDPDNRRPVDYDLRRRAAGPARRRLAAAGRRVRRGEAARGVAGAAAAPGPAGRFGGYGPLRATGRPPSTSSRSTAAAR